MMNYSEMTTPDLIDLLLKEGDRVALEQIETLAGRGEEAAPKLREFLADEDLWYEGKDQDHFIVIHALVTLGLMRDAESLPLMLRMLEHSYFSDHIAASSLYPSVLAEYGAFAVEPGLRYIQDLRGAYRDNQDFAHCRHDVTAALTRIALADDRQRERVGNFLLDLFRDPAENDFVLLSLSAAYPAALLGDPGLKVLKEAYHRRAISPTIAGSYREMIAGVQDTDSGFYYHLQTQWRDFYTPEQMDARAKMRAEDAEQKLYWGFDDQSVPPGYAVAETGNVLRTDKIGRNDPCPCGSGKKYKKCCGAGG
jgi:hypothetical protein